MIASIFFMSNLMEFEEISAKMRLERNRGAGQSISSLAEGAAPALPQSNGHAVRDWLCEKAGLNRRESERYA
jgi:hypothetical protein